MKVSLNWIEEYTGNLNASAEEIANKIRKSLSEVEHIENFNEKYKDLVVAEIMEKEDHPNADKLGVYKISSGDEYQPQVVAGDKNLCVGDQVVYIPVDTEIPNNPFPEKSDGIIKKTKIRGIESEGMLASEKELGISDDHDRVMILVERYEVGENFAKAVKLDDYILEIENKPLTIRPDAFGIIGIAREVSAMFDKPFKTPAWLKSSNLPEPKEETLKLKIYNKLENLCPRYTAIAIKNIKVKESPLWLKIKLASVGVKPINNVVDITNYLMILTGQPLHAFDYDKLISKDIHAKDQAIITVRTARQGEKITLLNGKTIELDTKSVVICDSQNPIALGGIMGGLDTEVDYDTKNIILESANFDLYNIRRTSMSLGIFTEAATRFSKGQDPNLCRPVLHKAVEMLQELCEGITASEVQDEGIELPKPHKLSFSISYLNKHTGLNLPKKEILKILSNVEINEISQESNTDDFVTVEIPTYRQDLKISEDIHEEVARLYGYEKIDLTLPKRSIKPPRLNPDVECNKKIRTILKSIGANEVLTYNFVGEKLYKNCDLNLERNYRIKNPISPDLEYMRSTLLPSLLEKTILNINQGYEEFAIFEINKAHNKLDIEKDGILPKEHRLLTLVFYKDIPHNYYHTKYFLDILFKQLRCLEVNYESINKINKENLPNFIRIVLQSFDINKTAVVSAPLNKEKIYLGIIGEPNLQIKENFKLKQAGMFEINLDNLQRIIDSNNEIINFSKFPKIQQDFCFILDKDIPYIILEKTINKALEGRDLNYIIKPLDIYQTEEENRQITFNITIQHKNKTLKEKDINSIRKLIEKKVFKETGGKLKGEN
jgi:phenylalanyl-tRNA synthetase beta chain